MTLDQEKLNWMKGTKKPFLIAGPCSAESEEQLRSSVMPILNKVDYVRAGIWKPRTRPGNFEGVGEKGLVWINTLKKEMPFHFATEVGTPEHVELALKHQVDLVWIGARTTVNPFLVSELAEVLRGTDLPVLIKNPIHPELALWKGAIERFAKNNVRGLGAIHRGFHSYQKSLYRNIPLWQIPLDLKSEFPELPLLCDPSHIGGDRQMISKISQKALNLAYDGLMIETHYAPDQALSDAQQQVSPQQLLKILDHLTYRRPGLTEETFLNQLEIIREQIDQADLELLQALAKRMDLVAHIGEIKKEHNVAIFQISRWKEIFKSRLEMGKEFKLDESFIMEMLRLLHQQSVKKQTEIFDNEPSTHKNG